MDFDSVFNTPPDSNTKADKLTQQIAESVEPMFIDQCKYFAEKRASVYEMVIACNATVCWFLENQVLPQQMFDIELIHAIQQLREISISMLKRKLKAELTKSQDESPNPVNPENN